MIQNIEHSWQKRSACLISQWDILFNEPDIVRSAVQIAYVIGSPSKRPWREDPSDFDYCVHVPSYPLSIPFVDGDKTSHSNRFSLPHIRIIDAPLRINDCLTAILKQLKRNERHESFMRHSRLRIRSRNTLLLAQDRSIYCLSRYKFHGSCLPIQHLHISLLDYHSASLFDQRVRGILHRFHTTLSLQTPRGQNTRTLCGR